MAAKSSSAAGVFTNAAPPSTRTRRATRPEAQVPRTPTPDQDLEDEETERILEAELERVERQNQITKLQERITLARGRNSQASSAASSQTLLGDPVIQAPAVEASGAGVLEERPGPFHTGTKQDLLPLSTKLSVISIENLKSIAENICRLHNDYTQVKPEKIFIRMGEVGKGEWRPRDQRINFKRAKQPLSCQRLPGQPKWTEFRSQ